MDRTQERFRNLKKKKIQKWKDIFKKQKEMEKKRFETMWQIMKTGKENWIFE